MSGAEFKMVIDNKIELSMGVGCYGVSLLSLEPIEKGFYKFISEDELSMLFSLLEKRKEIRNAG